MITNERQYAITKAQVERFKEALEQSGTQQQNLHPRALKALRAGIESQLQDLQAEIADYEGLRGGKVASITADSILDIAQALIKARVVRSSDT